MSNELEIIVKESGLDKTKSQTLLDNFKNYFELASEWEIKAKTICVKDDTQVTEMKMARTGRLFLREKRIAIEKTRKELKEQALREGKAIDGIANVLKALIIPIEEYLDKQEHFVEIKQKVAAEKKRIEDEKKAEEERIAKEKADEEERIRIKEENERLKKEAEEKEKQAQAEREVHEKALAEERAKAEAEKKRQEAELQKQREEADRKQREADAKAQAEQDRIKKEAEDQAEIARKEKEKLEEQLKNQIECPKCHHKFQLKGEK